MDWSFIAGYGDGEGCLLYGIVRRNPQKRPKFSLVDNWYIYPSWQISSYDYEVLKKIKLFLEQNNIKTNCFNLKPIRPHRTKSELRLALMGWNNIENFLQKIYPYSIAKKSQYRLYFKLHKLRKYFIKQWTKDLFIKAMTIIDRANSYKSRQRGKRNTKFFKKMWNIS